MVGDKEIFIEIILGEDGKINGKKHSFNYLIVLLYIVK